MPELPEVETIVQQLRKRVVGKTIKRAAVKDRKVADTKLETLVSARILSASRKGKIIIIELDKGRFLLTELRMTGHFHHYPKGTVADKAEEKYVAVTFFLNDGSLLTFNEVRRFGRMRLLGKEQLQQALDKLGRDVLAKEFTLNAFRQLLEKRKKTTVKIALMDQHLLAGVGNIYAQEALYRAKILPQRKNATLSAAEMQNLYRELLAVLHLAVKHRGTTVENYVHIEGSGGFQNYLQVYQREKCSQGHPLKKEYVGGRGTYYCGKCQR